MARMLRNVSFVIVCLAYVITSRQVVRAEVCEVPVAHTGFGESASEASGDCGSENLRNDACDDRCDDGGSHWWGSATGSCSEPQVCGFNSQTNDPYYCSTIILECHRDELE
ncbi:MAG TPA: hypothetical protein VN700_00370 [Vicinamibacterales bacterium]|nr:hypothetical protein [Vicinamibacterales bacterium]